MRPLSCPLQYSLFCIYGAQHCVSIAWSIIKITVKLIGLLHSVKYLFHLLIHSLEGIESILIPNDQTKIVLKKHIIK